MENFKANDRKIEKDIKVTSNKQREKKKIMNSC